MKKSTLFVMSVVLLYASLTANAQIFTVKAGYNLADMKVGGRDGVDQNKPKSGFHAGILTEFPFKKHLSIEPGLLFSTKGSKSSYYGLDSFGKYDTRLYYLDIPVNCKFDIPLKTGVKLFALAGPYLAIGLSGKLRWEQGGMISGSLSGERKVRWGEDKDYKRADCGISAGGGVEVRRMHFSISYDYGLNKILDLGSVYVNNRVLKFSVGYRFGKALI